MHCMLCHVYRVPVHGFIRTRVLQSIRAMNNFYHHFHIDRNEYICLYPKQRRHTQCGFRLKSHRVTYFMQFAQCTQWHRQKDSPQKNESTRSLVRTERMYIYIYCLEIGESRLIQFIFNMVGYVVFIIFLLHIYQSCTVIEKKIM